MIKGIATRAVEISEEEFGQYQELVKAFGGLLGLGLSERGNCYCCPSEFLTVANASKSLNNIVFANP